MKQRHIGLNKFLIIEQYDLIYLCLLLIPIFSFISGSEGSSYGIPRKIWQTYRDKQLPRPAAEVRESWLRLNPNYEYTFMDDAEIEEYVITACDPEMYEFFKALPIGVMKADLWRYLIVADRGGIYTDIDTLCYLPIDYWITFLCSLNKIEAGKPLLFVGLENERGFCQWTFMATPKHPAMSFVCRYLLDNWRKNGLSLHASSFIHITTGPTIWKSALLNYLNEPESTKTSVIWNKYNSDKGFRKKVNDLGVYLLSYEFYNGFAMGHLNGSTQFKEGYISWKGQGYLYRTNPKNHPQNHLQESK
jgi:hypothetical protein